MTAWDCLHSARLRVTRARIGGANQRHAHVHVHRMLLPHKQKRRAHMTVSCVLIKAPQAGRVHGPHGPAAEAASLAQTLRKRIMSCRHVAGRGAAPCHAPSIETTLDGAVRSTYYYWGSTITGTT